MRLRNSDTPGDMPEPRDFADGSEDLPLLDDSESRENEDSEAVVENATSIQLTTQKRKRIVFLLALAIFCFATSNGLSETAVMRISEDNLCRRYYASKGRSDKSIDEQLCKVEDVQSALAYLNGFQSALDATVGTLRLHLCDIRCQLSRLLTFSSRLVGGLSVWHPRR